MRQRLNSLLEKAAELIRTIPSLQWNTVVVACCDAAWRNWETSQDKGKDECSNVHRHPGCKPAPEQSWPQTGTTGHLSAGQQPWAHSQDTKEWFQGNSVIVREWPRLESEWKSLERSGNGSAPIQTWRSLRDAAKGNGRNCPKLGEPSFWHHIQKDLKLQLLQRCINNVLS